MPAAGERLVLGLDTSPIHRPEAATFADRTLVDAPNLPTGVAPTRPGWAFSTLAVLPDPVSRWTYTLDNQRVPSTTTATALGAARVAAILPLLPPRPVLVADGHYGTAKWLATTAVQPCDQVLRAKRTAVLYRPAPPPTGKRGAPRKDRARFQGSDPTTHGEPDAQWAGTAITAIRITRAGAEDTKRDPREVWFWWLGDALPHLYARRFGVERGHRASPVGVRRPPGHAAAGAPGDAPDYWRGRDADTPAPTTRESARAGTRHRGAARAAPASPPQDPQTAPQGPPQSRLIPPDGLHARSTDAACR